jgi:gamma-glutamylcyclotransferase (GGCT)/AIG2-like uncharacterized protein YtfP
VTDRGALTAEHRLATYGTLAPGRRNHPRVSTLEGCWFRGAVRGRLVDAGWGADYGFPGLVLDAAGDDVTVDVLESAELPAHWSRLDVFEGPAYRRVTTSVSTALGALEASIYVLATGEGSLPPAATCLIWATCTGRAS